MTQNLRISGERLLTQNDTDIDDGVYTIPARSSSYNIINEQTPVVIVASNHNYGAYYSWVVATAGYTGEAEAPNSICPRGWELPSSAQWNNFAEKYNSHSDFTSYPINLVLSGEAYSDNDFCCSEDYHSGTNYGSYFWSRDNISCMGFGSTSNKPSACGTLRCCGGSNSGYGYAWTIRCTSKSN